MPENGPRQTIDYYASLGFPPQTPTPQVLALLDQRLAQTPPGPGRAYLEQARAVLGDPEKRRIYDARLYDTRAPGWTGSELDRLARWVSVGSGAGPGGSGGTRAQAKPGRRRRIALLGAGATATVIALIAGLVVLVGPGSSSDCDDIVFIGAAGSGQRGAETIGLYGGMGGYVHATAENLVADAAVAGKTVEVRPVDYPAAAVSTIGWELADLLLQGTGTVGEEFVDSLAQGTATATAMIETAVKQCPGSTIVVAGYSQGAMVMHRALQSIEPNDSVVAVLIADGDRNPADPVARHNVNGGRIAPYTGISFTDLGRLLSGVSGDGTFPAGWDGRIISWCLTGDTVCSNEPGNFELDRAFGAAIHTAGYDPEEWRPYLAELAVD